MIFRIFNCIGSSPRNTTPRVLAPLGNIHMHYVGGIEKGRFTLKTHQI